MNTEEVESLCAALSLEGNKEPVAELYGELQLASRRKLDLSVVGRLLATRKINRDAFRAIIPKIWRTTQDVEIEVLRKQIEVVCDIDVGASGDCIGSTLGLELEWILINC
ncbi:hypothetical protein ACOSQ3_033223 [Xanthoceras sorbifolium]